jgi:hypothetical protein
MENTRVFSLLIIWFNLSDTMVQLLAREGLSLFPDRGSPGETPIAQLPFHPNPGPGSRSFGHFSIYSILKDSVFHNYRDTVSNSELLTRAWVFQEWALSRGILCATPFGLLMQC